MKKKVMILLSVVIVIAAGCGNKNTDVITSIDATEAVTEDTSDIEKVTESVEEETDTTEADNKEDQNAQTVKEDSESNAPEQTESKTQTNSNNNSDTQNPDSPSQQEPQQTEPTHTDSTPQPSRIEYSPQNVVALATAKTKAAGKVLLTENLDNLLANGQISQEEYNEYYPYDGAGYYSVFVDSNLAEARDVSGTENLDSEDKIAQYISDMLVLENGPYFLI